MLASSQQKSSDCSSAGPLSEVIPSKYRDLPLDNHAPKKFGRGAVETRRKENSFHSPPKSLLDRRVLRQGKEAG